MSQIIVYQNPEGTNICICHPTGELPIEEVLVKDCPVGAVIVDESELPQGASNQFFDAWEFNGSTIVVNLDKAKAIKLAQFNDAALQIAQKRQLNTLTGVSNAMSDANFLVELSTGRKDIISATTTDDLALIVNPS